jgi:TonB family protein
MRLLTQLSQICVFFIVLLSISLPVSASSQGQDSDFDMRTLAEIEEQRQKLANNQNDPLIYYTIGELYKRIHRLEDSAAAFEQAVRTKPDFAVAYYRLGWTYSNLSKFDEALEAHKQALASADKQSFKLKITRAEAQFAIGWDYYCQRRYDDAIAAYQETLQFDSGYEDALYEIGRVQIAQGNLDEATQTASRLTTLLRSWLTLEQSLLPGAVKTDNQTGQPPPIESNRLQPAPMGATLKPSILYKEKARYTERARQKRITGKVVLSVIFDASAQITQVRVIHGLPYGLTAHSILAAQKIRFQPALKDGQPVSVRGNLEYTFYLY